MLTVAECEKKTIFNVLKELSICNRCILRYLGYTLHQHGQEIFKNPGRFLSDMFCTGHEDVEIENKKLKVNPCRSCLNVLNDSTIENYITTLTDDFKTYEMQDYYITLNFPIALSVREYGMFLYLKEKFPDIYKDFYDIEKIKRVFRINSSDMLSLKLTRSFKEKSNFHINMNIVYVDDKKETENLHKISSDKKISKKFINNSLYIFSIDYEVFKKYFPVPPTIQDSETSVNVTLSSSAVYLGGRYLKFSRDMGQTPFVVNNISVTEHSVQEVLFDVIVKVLSCDKKKLSFSSSGREDADTRMIGTGRPFYIQIDEPKFEKITFEQCRDIEASIADSNTVVVIQLQQVLQNSIKQIKFGEQEKQKHYHAVCKTLAPNVEDVIHIINSYGDSFLIEQATPVRVLHRRTHLKRERKIFKMGASLVQGYSDLFYLDVITQAGTYVKEFVNGDFHRTNPNISKLTGYPCDVVTLDVTHVQLEWPDVAEEKLLTF